LPYARYPSVPVASWRDFGALLAFAVTNRSGKGKQTIRQAGVMAAL
jgi:hypothetical protein